MLTSPQAIFDSCHSGTLLDLPHHHCNQIYVPWLSTGRRRTRTMQYQITRRFARSTSHPRPTRPTN
ncbi:hypothetical protein EWM64_g8291 [Hericium alpestre]|uniref:Uncharacterized protein n=1 Tax=Hericium alpestre TaxID=135208 RepID=A0A4Y9ZPH0_9AGAM|nr:hypothetical protein EWM64_g8291 [Hericium alpestre]